MIRPRVSRRFASTVILSISLAATLFSVSASAKPVGPAASGAAIEACLLADDAQTGETATKFGCCSREAGICVICPQPPSANNRCEVTPYRKGGMNGLNQIAPGEFQNQYMK